MTINLTLPPDVEGQLIAIAEQYNIPVEAYILSLLESVLPKDTNGATFSSESEEDFRAAMTMLHRPNEKPLYPDETWSRATIYQDHD